jgi:hypothetical protein
LGRTRGMVSAWGLVSALRSFRVPVFLSPLAIPIAWLAYAQDRVGNVFSVVKPGSAIT